MKKYYYLASALAALSMTGCQDEMDALKSNSSNNSSIVITAGVEGQSSRTSVSEGSKILWQEDDELSIFLGNTTNQKFGLNSGAGKNFATFKGEEGLIIDGSSSNINAWANVGYYPYGDENSVTLTKNEDGEYVISATFPAEQTYTQNSFGQNVYPMVAVTESKNDIGFAFKNISSILKVSLKGDVTITKAELMSAAHKLAGAYTVTAANDKEPVMTMATNETASSTITLNCGENGVQLSSKTATEFWFAIPTGTYEANDLTLKFYSNGTQYFESPITAENEFVRSEVKNFDRTYQANASTASILMNGTSYETISAAVTAASENATIYVKAGEYKEVVNVKGGKTVTIQPMFEGDEVTIAGVDHTSNGNNPSTVTFNNITFNNSLQENGWFTGTGQNLKPCVGVWGGNLTFNKCTFEVSGESSAETGVMTWWTTGNGITLKFDGCTFNGINNNAEARGMQIYGNVDLTVENCTFNTSKRYSLKYVGTENKTAILANNTVNNAEYFVELGSTTYKGNNYTIKFSETTLGDNIGYFKIANEENQTVYIDGNKYIADGVGLNEETSTYEVSSATGLAYASANLFANGGTFNITDDIDMTDVKYTPATVTKSLTINGNKKTISNLTVSGDEVEKAALVGRFGGGSLEIKDLIISKSKFAAANNKDGEYSSAALVGWLENHTSTNTLTISGCTVSNVEIGSTKYVGGLVAYHSGEASLKISNCTIENSTFNSEYTEDNSTFKGHCGGVVGYLTSGEISSCTVSNNTFSVKGDRIGLLIGSAQASAKIGTGNKVSDNGNTVTSSVGSVDNRADKTGTVEGI